ncbi:hypothetical protein HYC85_008677 [Camellia sinensis]|uniref:CBS domain-containing protein n=1 Tax=Camellia sinensis TaxID=4442 RepID=A0A7J7HU98_CAMSI|nr:hypothetical protein HYC85_008677 [Camellia sinensis]
MFYSGLDYAKETGEATAGTTLIPTQFVWPYGGGSWSDHYPMTPVEGCPTVFQTICSLPPSYHQGALPVNILRDSLHHAVIGTHDAFTNSHRRKVHDAQVGTYVWLGDLGKDLEKEMEKYKIVIDGEWRHDEHQPFENRNYGQESDYVPGILNPQMHSGSNMDVDNESFQRLLVAWNLIYLVICSYVRVSGGPLHEALPRVSEADLEVIALDVDLPVKLAFHILHEQTSYFQGIPMAPLGDFCMGQFVGVLSALDFIMIVRELGSHGSNLMEEELETHTISAWKDAKSYLSRQIDGNGRLFPRQLVHAGPDENLKDVALKIFQNNVATVPVIHSSSCNASIPQLLHIASLSGILKCKFPEQELVYFKHSFGTLPMLQLPICAIPLGTWVLGIGETNRRPLAMLRPRSSLGLALSLLVQVSSIPIVDDNDSLLNVYSRSDINALAKDKIYTHINLEEMTINQHCSWDKGHILHMDPAVKDVTCVYDLIHCIK